MNEEDLAVMAQSISHLLKQTDAITDVIAIICLRLRVMDSAAAESVATVLEGMQQVEGVETSKELKWLAGHLTPHLRGDLDAPFLSLQKPPLVRDREQLRDLMQVLPGGGRP